MSEYYAVQRSGEYLKHYGVIGMKWGVHRAMSKSGPKMVNRLNKQYKKASKKLAKLEKKANSSKKYKAKAAALGAGAALAGTTAAFGPGKVAKYATRGAGHAVTGIGEAVRAAGEALSKNPKTKAKGYRIQAAGHRMRAAGGRMKVAGTNAGAAIEEWGKGHTVSRGISKTLTDIGTKVQTKNLNKYGSGAKKAAAKVGTASWKAGRAVNTANLTNNQMARIGAAALGVGLAGAAGVNAFRAASTKRYAKKAAKFKAEMNKAFAGTKYANGTSGKKKTSRQGNKRRK